MHIHIAGSYSETAGRDLSDKAVVIIDVFRTTSLIPTALANGARCVIPVEQVEQARNLAMSHPGALLAGERNALPLPGFQLDNSPLSCTPEKVRGKVIIMTTTNGTRSVTTHASCAVLYIASFLNVSAVVDRLRRTGRDLLIVCAGNSGSFSIEDGLCAGMVVSRLRETEQTRVSDLAWGMMKLSQSIRDLREPLEPGSTAYGFLMDAGYQADIDYCLEMDALAVVPVLDGQGKLVPDDQVKP